MTPAETALHFQHLHSNVRRLRTEIARVEQHLASDSEMERLEAQLAAARARRLELEERAQAVDRDTEELRHRVQARERELMSGHIRDSGGLLRLRDEVERLKAALAGAEDAELTLLEDLEGREREVGRLERALEERRAEAERTRPELQRRREEALGRLEPAEAEEQSVWAELSNDWRSAIENAQAHHPDAVVQVVDGQCGSCHVAVTSSAARLLRHGELLLCDNCGRLLVID